MIILRYVNIHWKHKFIKWCFSHSPTTFILNDHCPRPKVYALLEFKVLEYILKLTRAVVYTRFHSQESSLIDIVIESILTLACGVKCWWLPLSNRKCFLKSHLLVVKVDVPILVLSRKRGYIASFKTQRIFIVSYANTQLH